MFCRKCGKELTEGSEFCSYCGSPTKTAAEHKVCELPEVPHKSKKPLFVILIVAVALLLVGGVLLLFSADKIATKATICEDISQFENFDQLDLEIKDYKEEKRDTDKAAKSDKIWVEIVAENATVSYNASYLITYGLYNDGWLLENIEIIENDYYALQNPELAEVSDDLQNAHKSVINTYELTNIAVDADVPPIDTSRKLLTITCVATAENQEMTVEATVEANYRLEMSGWILSSSNIGDYSYEAKHGPSVALIEETTRNWTGEYEWVSETLSYPDNEFIITYEEHDEDGLKNCVVDWENTLTYYFDPEKDGWYLADEDYKVIDVTLDLAGYWTYENGNEYISLNVISADSGTIKYDLDFSIVSTNILNVGNTPSTNSGTGLSRDWTYEYDEDELCLVFTATKPVFTISYIGGSYTDEYILYYKAYLGEIMGTSGFCVNRMQLTNNS